MPPSAPATMSSSETPLGEGFCELGMSTFGGLILSGDARANVSAGEVLAGRAVTEDMTRQRRVQSQRFGIIFVYAFLLLLLPLNFRSSRFLLGEFIHDQFL